MNHLKIQHELAAMASEADALHLMRFFKTAPGQYGHGDIFRGIRVPVLRTLASGYQDLPLEEAKALLHSPYHEDRQLALFILMRIYAKGKEGTKEAIYQLYLDNTRHINNWDLVDCSAHYIVGNFLLKRDRSVLYELATSLDLWERRIGMISTWHFIRKNEFKDTLSLAERLLADKEDLMHKAVGWMLREVGNRNQEAEEEFLRVHYPQMPRTMLRYAIEKFPEPLRQAYLKGRV